MIAPVFEKLADNNRNIVFYTCDVDDVPKASSNVRAMPTFVLYRNGNKIKEVVGANRSRLEQFVTNANSL